MNPDAFSDLALWRLIQHEALSGRRDSQDQAARLSADNQVVLGVHGERSGVRLLRLEEDRASSVGFYAKDVDAVRHLFSDNEELPIRAK